MNSTELWNVFYKSGSVKDYLNYRAEVINERKQGSEVYDRRTDNKRNQCR
jgi:hypothetical protein